MQKPDGSDLTITLLRSVEWLIERTPGWSLTELEASGKIAGKGHPEVILDLAEIGAAGPATILSVDPCPTIEPGPGRVVTGTFQHSSADVIDLYVSGEPKPIGTTRNHPFWSETRKEFVKAGSLIANEELRTVSGKQVFVLNNSVRAESQSVYNIEVDIEHVYYVGLNGLLVHNTYDSQKLGKNLTKDGYGARPVGYHASHIVPTGKFSTRTTHKKIKEVQRKFDTHLPGRRNDSINGFWGDSRHNGTHTDDYFDALYKEFKNVTDTASAEAAMANIWARIESGEF